MPAILGFASVTNSFNQLKRLTEYCLRQMGGAKLVTVHDVMWHWHDIGAPLYTSAFRVTARGRYNGSLGINVPLARIWAEHSKQDPPAGWFSGLDFIEALQDEFDEEETMGNRAFAANYSPRSVFPFRQRVQ
jgi:hypothetical protein